MSRTIFSRPTSARRWIFSKNELAQDRLIAVDQIARWSMNLKHGLQLAYCTNVHRGETWAQTFDSLEKYSLAVKERVSPNRPFAIGLRLSNQAAFELNGDSLYAFKRWLEKNDCYIFTINGFPYGQFHGARVKEQVYRPDWAAPERLDYTKRLFDLLVELLPPEAEGSVSTLPGSFKEFVSGEEYERRIRNQIWECVEHVAMLSERTGRKLHLGVEPEPLGWFENTAETLHFFERMRAEHPEDDRLGRHLGVNYDACHFAVEFEEAGEALRNFELHGIKLSKIHLSSAMKLKPTEMARKNLEAFADDVYLHQVVARSPDGSRRIFKDLRPALDAAKHESADEEWRVHFHVPLHSPGAAWYETTVEHALGVLNYLKSNPQQCRHLEMETYTWEVLPEALKSRTVVDQLAAEYEWTLAKMAERDLA